MTDNRYCVDYARLGTSGCKKCKVKIAKGSIRIAKVVSNPFSEDGGDMKQWHHVKCIFETFQRARATTKIIESADDLEGWDNVKKEDRDDILTLIKDFQNKASQKTPSKGKPTKQTTLKPTSDKKGEKRAHSPDLKLANDNAADKKARTENTADKKHPDNSFREFRRLCANVAEESSYNVKTNVISKFLSDGTSGNGFKGDLYLWVKMLLPGIIKRIYNVQSKQLVKLFSQIFGTDQEEMISDLEQGDVAETIKTFFEKSTDSPPAKKSNLTVYDVDEYLEELSQVTKEDDQTRILKKITKRCTANDLKIIIRLIKHDLRINAGAKHVLEAVHPDAYPAFQASRNLKDVMERIEQHRQTDDGGKPSLKRPLSIRASLMTPVLPMLAEACKSVDIAMKKCPNGMYAEVKYDGERVQLHKKGSEFTYFSRSLKPVLPHKVQQFKDYIPRAFPHGNDMILDSEVLLIDTSTGIPLPFGTLGKHKRTAFKDANVCLFVFDCIYYNGQSLMDKPLKERKKMLSSVMKEIPNRVMFTEEKLINQSEELQDLIMKVLRKGLEGLVLKDSMSIYEPGKRHWLKVKKDYLNEGAMADSADLVVLGAFFGTGNKGGMMSIFLMGCYDSHRKKWCTVTKVHGGHDDQTLERLQKELKMVKISKDQSKVPPWLDVTKNMVPDFVAKDPKTSQVWEITGAEFTKAEIHTAKGISIRFPRVTRIRSDKTWETATNLNELEVLVKNSKDSSALPDLSGSDSGSPVKRRKMEPKKPTSAARNSKNEDEDDYSGDTEVEEEMPQTPKKKKKETPSKGEKRKNCDDDDNDNELPNKKTKPFCKYGASCYQTNAEHLSKFEHPEKRSPAKHAVKNPLPEVFTDVTVYLPKDTDQYEKLRRFVIAYDGDVVDEIGLSQATHVVADKKQAKKFDDQLSSEAKIVSVDWLWDSIRKKEMLPVKSYRLN